MTRFFNYKTVAALVSGRLFDDHDKVRDLVSFMTGQPVTPLNNAALMRVCRLYFLNAYPALKAMDFEQCSPAYYDCYEADFNDILGTRVAVRQNTIHLREAA